MKLATHVKRDDLSVALWVSHQDSGQFDIQPKVS